MTPLNGLFLLFNIILFCCDFGKVAANDFTCARRQNLAFAEATDEAMEHIAECRKIIPLDETKNGAILVLGNKGVGKTTISKFLTNGELKFTRKGNTLRLTIPEMPNFTTNGGFPELFINRDTNSFYYDLPSFPRSNEVTDALTELVNTTCRKIVADHLTKVKILFLEEYASLRISEHRGNFKNMLEHAMSFIVEPSKFRQSVAIIATKVPSDVHSELIVPEIVHFLQEAMVDFRSMPKAQEMNEFIQAFLTRNPITGAYERISYFQHSGQEGLSSKIPAITSRRIALQTMVERNLEFTSKTSADFAIILSDGAKYLVGNIQEKLNSKVRQEMDGLAQAIVQTDCNETKDEMRNLKTENSMMDSSEGKFVWQSNHLQNIINMLEHVSSREMFFSKLTLQLELPTLATSRQGIFNSLLILVRRLKFYENINPEIVATAFVQQWLTPLKNVLPQLELLKSQNIWKLNQIMTNATRTIVTSLFSKFNATSSSDKSASQTDSGELEAMVEKLKILLSDLLFAETFNQFVGSISNFVVNGSLEFSELGIQHLQRDIQFRLEPGLMKENWFLEFLTLYQKLLQTLYTRV